MRIGWLVLILSLLAGGWNGENLKVSAQPGKLGEEPLRQIWVVNIHGLTLGDLRETSFPHLREWLHHSVVGGMNLKTGGKETEANRYATLGAGTRAVAPTGEMFYHPKEQPDPTLAPTHLAAGLLYAQRMGRIPPSHAVIYPGIMEYVRQNEESPYEVQPGALGEVLKQKGLHVLALGNMDEGEKPVRYAPFLTMDKRGVTEEGEIGVNTLSSAPGRPFGVKTNYRRLEERLFSWNKPGLAVIDLGDLHRLQQFAGQMLPEQHERVKKEVLGEVDRFIGKVMAQADRDTAAVLVSPGTGVPVEKSEAEGLLPLLVYRKGEPTGLLRSATTRRPGIIANIDLAPTLLQLLGIDSPREMAGQPMQRVGGTLAEFWGTVERTETINRLRPSVLYSYVLFQIMVLLIGLARLLREPRRPGSGVQAVLLGVMLTPFLFLMVSGVTARSYWIVSALVFAAGMVASLLMSRLRTLPLLFWTGLVGFLPVILDGCLGGPLIQQSFLGYDPIKGARYYGIGNEYMGVVLGSTILTAAAWLEKRGTISKRVQLVIGILFLGVVLFFAAPFWGTNAGGALACAVGFGVAWVRFFHRGSRRWLLWQAGIFLVAGGLVLYLMNMVFHVGAPTHIGRAFGLLSEGNLEEILHIMDRKLHMNWKLIQFSSWGKLFLVSLGTMILLSLRPAGGLKRLMEAYPQLFNGFVAILAGSLAALAFNDSGIVAAATAIVYAVMPVMILAFREWSRSHDPSPEITGSRT
ncbi:hypothetical protein [Salinithrix halophila]|uniref:Phosphoglyceromutase n=1 Tax=Salinithrix halophila TaxID=1485204 RepID=A0ABV8JBV2_9BACL